MWLITLLRKRILADKNEESKAKAGLFGRTPKHSDSSKDSESNIKNAQTKSDDLDASPTPVAKPVASTPHHEHSVSNSAISFLLKNVTINPRKSVLTVVIKNSSSEPFEFNPDAIYIAEGTHKLGAEALRADFDVTSIEPGQEVKGIITIFSRPGMTN